MNIIITHSFLSHFLDADGWLSKVSGLLTARVIKTMNGQNFPPPKGKKKAEFPLDVPETSKAIYALTFSFFLFHHGYDFKSSTEERAGTEKNYTCASEFPSIK